ncbi:MAG: HPt (histidine-containing phosphotransfer) domain-containing protein [Flavobacteriales bacterium]|jgi:HPt (histidine-containing phosphotransfer) domain-containing protein
MKALELKNLIEIAGDDHSFVLDMLRIYLKNLPGMMNPLKTAFDNNDVDGISMWVHKLKSASGAAGSVLVLQQADLLEQLAIKNKPFAELEKRYAKLHMALELTLPEINNYLETN